MITEIDRKAHTYNLCPPLIYTNLQANGEQGKKISTAWRQMVSIREKINSNCSPCSKKQTEIVFIFIIYLVRENGIPRGKTYDRNIVESASIGHR